MWLNLANWERVLRLILGLGMLALAASGAVAGLWEVALAVFAWFPLVTGVLGWCPFYALFRFDSRQRRKP